METKLRVITAISTEDKLPQLWWRESLTAKTQFTNFLGCTAPKYTVGTFLSVMQKCDVDSKKDPQRKFWGVELACLSFKAVVGS